MPPINFRRITNNIYAGAKPSFKDLKELKNKGIKYILSLDAASAEEIKPFIENLQLNQILIPIDATSSSINDTIKYLNRNIVKILDNYQPIYVHCLYGSDRTGLAIALYKVKKMKMQHQQAISEVRRYGYGLGISPQTQKTWNMLLKSSEKNITLAADDKNYSLQYDITSLLRQVDQINFPENMNLSFAPHADTPYQAVDPNNIEEYLENTEILKMPQIGQYSNMAQTRGAGPVEGAGPLNIFQY